MYTDHTYAYMQYEAGLSASLGCACPRTRPLSCDIRIYIYMYIYIYIFTSTYICMQIDRQTDMHMDIQINVHNIRQSI